LSVQVFYPSTGGLLWSATFERNMSDFFELHAQLAKEIAGRLNVVIGRREEALVSRFRHVPPDAMEDYLTAHNLVDVQLDLARAIQLFLRATQRAPDFAEAFVGLATCYSLESAFFGALPSGVALERAVLAANRAIAIDPLMPEAWAERAFARFALERNWQAAEADFSHAIELDPNASAVQERYSNYLTIRGRHDEAIAAARKAEERAPLSTTASRQVAWAYYMAGEFDEAIQQLHRTLAIEPDYLPALTLLGRAYLLKDMNAPALEVLKGVGQDQAMKLALAYARSGRRTDAEVLLRDAQSPTYPVAVAPYEIALVYSALGQTDEAVRWLERAFERSDPAVVQIAVDPLLSTLRSDHRVQTVIKKLNLQTQ
jgi:tetratricopeptide (TPR) repeat protein